MFGQPLIHCKYSKIQTKNFLQGVIPPNDANGIINNEDPDELFCCLQFIEQKSCFCRSLCLFGKFDCNESYILKNHTFGPTCAVNLVNHIIPYMEKPAVD